MKLEMRFAVLLFAVALAAQGAEPAPKKPETKQATRAAKPDIAFLEYLGTLEGDDENWTDIANTVLTESRGKRAVKQEAATPKAAETK